ncbi:MAG: 2-oxoacid:ferredoxin oxidoreductase subunit beta [Methanobacteriaceae archaeon]|jgi:2-oxoglutarate ferredoxin oxidoreductase subunit beta|uniref:2-oxoacid:ferredoxin oxidoreductase subunit beta n=1 Tax=unclassified Methanobrevibacter TaxID=2638681 RepID=UPI002A0ECE1E|nr:2-oxoacid:ferredoxin oxidoreductase subunit beta [Methanobacteriaceae archaeon]MDD3408262.1 2-oxoacid:ferredoxin oxidoreductase subunit beta [Methanobacteriaceae archaeon]MDD4593525.1 2-oxoacid:ferredoxin oxidoreductase subunit beta [Methanobacteriaceae archaeon]
MVEEKQSPFLKYLREDRLPHIFCPGCGNGMVMNAFFKALEGTDIDFDNIAMVSGIGCSSRIPGYVKCDSLHTTHGRALPFATGLKVGNPDLDVIVFTGDGDGASIGGNHLIHAARRNINLTVICVNNNIYGMTGGQISPTSPKGSYATTAPYGSKDVPFNLSELVVAAGASYVARWTSTNPLQLVNSIKKGLNTNGFAFIEVVTQCPTYYGRKNKMKTATSMFEYLKENSINKRKADKMTPEEIEDKIIIGEFINRQEPEFTDNVQKLDEETSKKPYKKRTAYEEL